MVSTSSDWVLAVEPTPREPKSKLPIWQPPNDTASTMPVAAGFTQDSEKEVD
jgi:hypothetical protein